MVQGYLVPSAGPKAVPTAAGLDDHRTTPSRYSFSKVSAAWLGAVTRNPCASFLFVFTLLLLALYNASCPRRSSRTTTLASVSESGLSPVTYNTPSPGDIACPTVQNIVVSFIHIVNMVFSSLVARVTYYLSVHLSPDGGQASYAANGLDAFKALQTWYDSSTGLWDTAGWWNSANCLTVLADYAVADPKDANTLSIASIMSNTFANAQLTPVTVTKSISESGMYHSSFSIGLPGHQKRAEVSARGYQGFINDFYDDEGWWALALIRSWDVTQNEAYLDEAKAIFEDMKNGTDSTCGGGIWWSKTRTYKNAIANELYLSVAASLANRVTQSEDKTYYQQIAEAEWTWFQSSGMINHDNLINDGLEIDSHGNCTNNGGNTWSYNQGVILGGLVELSKATGDTSYLDVATTIAEAAVDHFADAHGIIQEGCEPNCGGDGSQFKGIFVRNLHYLQKVAPQGVFKNAILTNANSIWLSDRTDDDTLGINWAGPASAGGGPNATTHSSAMDAIVAAVAVA